jgi:hypothetical protein
VCDLLRRRRTFVLLAVLFLDRLSTHTSLHFVKDSRHTFGITYPWIYLSCTIVTFFGYARHAGSDSVEIPERGSDPIDLLRSTERNLRTMTEPGSALEDQEIRH